MAAITTRQTAGTGATVAGVPLTNTQLDTNFININTDLSNAVYITGNQTIAGTKTFSGNISITGTGKSAGQFDAGTVAPTNTTRLNYDGNFYATNFFGNGSNLTNLSVSSFGSQTANTVLIAPNGSAGNATFRALVAADLPTSITSNTSGTAANITANSNTSLTSLSNLTTVGTITTGTWSGSFGSVSGANLTSLNASNITSGTLSGDRGVTAGSASVSFIEYNGTTKTSGQFDGGSTAPTNTTRLNYDGYFYATRFYGDGSQLTNLPLPSGLTAGSASSGYLQYSGTTATSGQLNGSTTAPTNTTRLNYEGNFYATNLFGSGILTGIKATRIAIAASNIDINLANYFTRTISGSTTFTVSNIPSSGTTASFILDLTNGGSSSITWWNNIKWVSGSTPTLTAAGRDVLGFFTHDGGTTWTGLVLGLDIK